MANSYLLPEDPTNIDDPHYQGLVYTPEHGANQRGLEHKLAALDHGAAAAVFGTGMAALHAAFFTLLNAGDHAIVSNVVYMRVWGLLDNLLPAKLGIEVDFVDITDLDAVRRSAPPRGSSTPRSSRTPICASPTSRIWPASPTRPTPCSPSTPRSPRRRCYGRLSSAPTSPSTP